eukprot:2662953-Rhodomonas_salina.1
MSGDSSETAECSGSSTRKSDAPHGTDGRKTGWTKFITTWPGDGRGQKDRTDGRKGEGLGNNYGVLGDHSGEFLHFAVLVSNVRCTVRVLLSRLVWGFPH